MIINLDFIIISQIMFLPRHEGYDVFYGLKKTTLVKI